MTNARPRRVSAPALLGAVLALVCALAMPAAAQGTAQQQQACQSDALRLCGEFVPDVAKIQACMSRKRAQVSPGCRAAIVGTAHVRHGTVRHERTRHGGTHHHHHR